MKPKTGLRPPTTGQAFTLIEVLLVTALLLALLGAVVFSFSTLERGARLDEGASQFESLLRFARAHATSSGRQVQLVFSEEIEAGVSWPLGEVRVLWEPDPLGKPGVLEDLAQTRPYLERINEMVAIDSVRTPEMTLAATGESGESPEPDSTADLGEDGYLPPLTFYPDGSSDSAEITLSSRDPEDLRRVRLRLEGVVGVIRRVVLDAPGAAETTEEQQSETASSSKEGQSGVIEKPSRTPAAPKPPLQPPPSDVGSEPAPKSKMPSP